MVNLSICLSIYQSIHQSIYLSIDRSIYQSICLSSHPPSSHPAIFPSFYLPVCTPYTTLLACQDHLELPPAPLQALEISMSLNLLARKDSPQGVAWTRGSYESSLQHVATKLLGTWIHMPSKMYQHACFFLHFVIFFLSHPVDGCFGDTFASSGKLFLAAPPHSKDGTGVDSHPSISPKFTGVDCFTPGQQDMAWPWVINLGVQQPQGDASIIFARHKGEVRAIYLRFCDRQLRPIHFQVLTLVEADEAWGWHFLVLEISIV